METTITIPSGLEGSATQIQKVEWTNSLIKTVRRRTYGYKDNDYFFLKIMDESRREYVRNPKSHNYYD